MIEYLFWFIYYLFLFILVSFVIYICFKNSQYIKKNKIEIEHDGFLNLFSGTGNNFIAFNDSGIVRTGNLLSKKFREYPISRVYYFEWKPSLEKTRELNHNFIFYIDDVEYPIHKVFYTSKIRQAEYEWAKIQAIYRSQSEITKVENNPNYTIKVKEVKIIEYVKYLFNNNH